MKAVVLKAINQLEVTEIPTPEPMPGHLVIKMLACGICGTDRHILSGESHSTLPLVMGHEFGGIVSAVAPDSKFKVGDMVSIDPNIVCEKCDHCLAKRPEHCRKLTPLGVAINGGFAEFVLLPESQAYFVPNGTNPLHLGLVEPLACCIRGMDLSGIKSGAKVAVLGGGSMGMLLVQLAKLAGASEINLVTRQKERRVIAEKVGATRTIDPRAQDGRKELVDMDITFEVAGVIETFNQSLDITRAGGTVVVLGVVPSHETTPLNVHNILIKGLRIISSYLNPYTQARAVELIVSGKLDLDILISKTISLDELPEFLSKEPGQGDIKYLVTPN